MITCFEKNEIHVTGGKTGYIQEDGKIKTISGKDIFCGDCCKSHNLHPKGTTDKDSKTARQINAIFYINNDKTAITCGNCGREIEITETYETHKQKLEEKHKKDLENLHIVLVGSDWECGLKFYGLSAKLDYDDWLLVKKYFTYHRRGWSRGQELEWNFREPTGWLTQNPQAVEEILIKEGLIKTENTMKEIHKRAELEKKRKEKERKKEMERKEKIKMKMEVINEKINEKFNSNKVRQLDDAEATHYYRGDYGRGTVCRYTITDTEIVKCKSMGDFTFAVAIPYSEDVEHLIKAFYKLNSELWKNGGVQ